MGLVVRQITASEVRYLTVESLELDPAKFVLESPESLAAALRRAASYLCPCPVAHLIEAVAGAWSSLVVDPAQLKQQMNDALDLLLAYGDLVESNDVTSVEKTSSGTMIYLARPAFVRRASGIRIMVGVPPDDISIIPDEMKDKVLTRGHIREVREEPKKVELGATVSVESSSGRSGTYVVTDPSNTDQNRGRISSASPVGKALLGKSKGELIHLDSPSGPMTLVIAEIVRNGEEETENFDKQLHDMGMIEMSEESWLASPPTETPLTYLAQFDEILSAAQDTADPIGFSLLDPDRSVRHYRGRWVDDIAKSGRFLARRPQSFGSPLWCYVNLDGGYIRQFIDLPGVGSSFRGCDEGWRIQAAIDSLHGHPQVFEVEKTANAVTEVKVFSPLPSWVLRRWDVIGELRESRDALFTYGFPDNEVDEEIKFLEDKLWMTQS